MPSMKKDIRGLNGYRLIYMPEHPYAMNCQGWEGYVYEHILVISKYFYRPVNSSEVIHHLDGNRSNNKIENLLVIDRGQHAKLHMWLTSGIGWSPNYTTINTDIEKHKPIEPEYCIGCGITLQGTQKFYCSEECCALGRRKVVRPTKPQLISDIKNMSYLAIGRKYGVSDNAVRKWAKQYEILKNKKSETQSQYEM